MKTCNAYRSKRIVKITRKREEQLRAEHGTDSHMSAIQGQRGQNTRRSRFLIAPRGRSFSPRRSPRDRVASIDNQHRNQRRSRVQSGVRSRAQNRAPSPNIDSLPPSRPSSPPRLPHQQLYIKRLEDFSKSVEGLQIAECSICEENGVGTKVRDRERSALSWRGTYKCLAGNEFCSYS